MIPPNKITIKSDGNILELLETKNPPKGEVTFIYKYSKSKSKLGELLPMDEQTLTKLIKVNT